MGFDYLTVAICLALMVATTAFFSRKPADQREYRRSPPTLPHALPLIGHLPQFLWSTEGLLAQAA